MLSPKSVFGLFAIFIPALAVGPERLGAGQLPRPAGEIMVQTVSAATGAQTSEAQVSLEELLGEALEKNPGIRSASQRVKALRHRVPQFGSLPDPTVSAGWMGNIAPFSTQRGDPSSFRVVAAMQEIPYPGKLKLRGKIADREGEAAWWDYEAVRRSVVAEVKTASRTVSQCLLSNFDSYKEKHERRALDYKRSRT